MMTAIKGALLRPIRFSACTIPLGAAAAAEVGVVVGLNSGDASVSLLDQASRAKLRRFDVGKEPHHLMAQRPTARR
jgi:hypothetical protein